MKTLTVPSLFYYANDGFVNAIARHSCTLGLVIDGVVKTIETGATRTTGDVIVFKPARKTRFVYVELGCGSVLRFPWGAMEYFEDGRDCVDLENVELVEGLPLEVDQELEAFVF